MASVTKRQHTRADGSNGDKWVVRYLDPSTGKRPCKTFDLKKDAEAFKRKVEREVEDGTHTTSAESKTVSAVMGEFLASYRGRVADGRVGPERLYNLEGQL